MNLIYLILSILFHYWLAGYGWTHGKPMKRSGYWIALLAVVGTFSLMLLISSRLDHSSELQIAAFIAMGIVAVVGNIYLTYALGRRVLDMGEGKGLAKLMGSTTILILPYLFALLWPSKSVKEPRDEVERGRMTKPLQEAEEKESTAGSFAQESPAAFRLKPFRGLVILLGSMLLLGAIFLSTVLLRTPKDNSRVDYASHGHTAGSRPDEKAPLMTRKEYNEWSRAMMESFREDATMTGASAKRTLVGIFQIEDYPDTCSLFDIDPVFNVALLQKIGQTTSMIQVPDEEMMLFRDLVTRFIKNNVREDAHAEFITNIYEGILADNEALKVAK